MGSDGAGLVVRGLRRTGRQWGSRPFRRLHWAPSRRGLKAVPYYPDRRLPGDSRTVLRPCGTFGQPPHLQGTPGQKRVLACLEGMKVVTKGPPDQSRSDAISGLQAQMATGECSTIRSVWSRATKTSGSGPGTMRERTPGRWELRVSYLLALLIKVAFPAFMRHRWRDVSRTQASVAVAMYGVVRALLSDDSLGTLQ